VLCVFNICTLPCLLMHLNTAHNCHKNSFFGNELGQLLVFAEPPFFICFMVGSSCCIFMSNKIHVI
jgi:hypothetical protein